MFNYFRAIIFGGENAKHKQAVGENRPHRHNYHRHRSNGCGWRISCRVTLLFVMQSDLYQTSRR